MFLDWITLRLDRDSCPDWGGWSFVRNYGDRVMRYCPKTGDVLWESFAWDSVRSDSHQVAIRCTLDSLWIQGSPARVCGTGDAVFGGAFGLDIVHGARSMIDFIMRINCWGTAPEHRLWKVIRVDVTQNYDLWTLANVRVALSTLRGTEGGRYRVSQQSGDTVYWSHLSALRSGKAYAKGPHLTYLMKKKGYTGYQYSAKEIESANRLLRLELSLKGQWFRENRSGKPWYRLTENDLTREHDTFFMRMIGDGEIEMSSLQFIEKCENVAPTPGQGRAAARTWTVIQAAGWQAARESMPSRTWYRHLKILKDAGLSDCDLSHGRVVGLRRSVELRPVSSWHHLAA